MRDEAHYGATIGFDDCENIKNMEPDKRALLLAGNSRGAQVSFKEPVGQSGWRTRYINNFAPRLFSSIRETLNKSGFPKGANLSILISVMRERDRCDR
jgi:hypothetical protein